MKALDYTKATYTVQIELPESVDVVFSKAIDLAKWWPEEYEGEPVKPGTEFILKTGDGHYSRNKIIEFILNKKLAWITEQSLRKADGYDWTGTMFIFELTPNGKTTIFKFTYDGVVLESEKERLVRVCDKCIKDMFYDFVVNGKTKEGLTDTAEASYSATTEVTVSPQDIFKCITADVAKWWGGKDFSGRSMSLNDEFIVNHPGAHYSKQKLVEVIADKKLVWLVTGSDLSWLENKEEWTDTRMIFEITAKDYSYLLHFTHEGLTPSKESYKRCSEGWNMVIKDWLYTLIMYGQPHFEL